LWEIFHFHRDLGWVKAPEDHPRLVFQGLPNSIPLPSLRVGGALDSSFWNACCFNLHMNRRMRRRSQPDWNPQGLAFSSEAPSYRPPEKSESRVVPKFGSIEARSFSWRSFLASSGLHAGIIILLLSFPLLRTAEKEYEIINVLNLKPPLTLPSLSSMPRTPVSERLTPPVRLVEPELKQAEVPREPEKKLEPPQIPNKPVIPEPAPPAQLAATDEAEAAKPIAKPAIAPEVFSGSSAPATTVQPRHQVQTGGFGDPLATSAEPSLLGKNLTRAATLGSFELPVGPGQGNGSGGERGMRGTIKSAGFGNGIAGNGAGSGSGQDGSKSGRNGVRSGGFGDQTVSPEASQKVMKESEPALEPVEIISKPKPAYTEEARNLRLEGAVVLEVLFTASGEVRVLRVVRGLGHGLDEAAMRAAGEIRFKPAQRGARAVDHRATVQIIFRMT
jgi:TonB family protein